MKTTKKGFTLIELIVVIAIIGVLAAILIPSMLGYVRKSKVSAANSAASSIQKGFEAALTDGDAKGMKFVYDGWIGFHDGKISASIKLSAVKDYSEHIIPGVINYFDKFNSCDGGAYVLDGSCIGVWASSDGTYAGTAPSGVVSPDDYKKNGAYYNADWSLDTNDKVKALKTALEKEIGIATTTSTT